MTRGRFSHVHVHTKLVTSGENQGLVTTSKQRRLLLMPNHQRDDCCHRLQ